MVATRTSSVDDSWEEGRILDGEQGIDNSTKIVGRDVAVSAQIRWINFILGAAVLLPWNAVITAMPYFNSRLEGSTLQSTFSSYLSTTFTVSNFCFLAHATITTRQCNKAQRTRRALYTITILVLLLTLSTFVSLPPALFFFLVILNGALQAAAGAYLQSSVVALASLFGPSVIQPVMTGQAAVGVLVSLIQVLSAGAGINNASLRNLENGGDESSAARAAFLFFAMSALFLVFSIAAHAWLLRLPEYKAIVVPFEAKKDIAATDEEREALVGGEQTMDLLRKKDRIKDLAKLNAEYNFAVAYVFVITLCVFPPITSSIRSVDPSSSSIFTHPLLFTALHFLIFNIGDIIGRYLPMYRWFQFWSSRTTLYMSLARTLFVPLFLLCNVQRPGSTGDVPVIGGVVINSDLVFFLIVLFFGITNGHVNSLVMMAAPSPEHNYRLKHRPEDVDTAATIAQFCLVGGLAIGSFSSFGVRGAICACNPFTT